LTDFSATAAFTYPAGTGSAAIRRTIAPSRLHEPLLQARQLLVL
jgi:hypothetical protein